MGSGYLMGLIHWIKLTWKDGLSLIRSKVSRDWGFQRGYVPKLEKSMKRRLYDELGGEIKR